MGMNSWQLETYACGTRVYRPRRDIQIFRKASECLIAAKIAARLQECSEGRKKGKLTFCGQMKEK